MSYKMELSQEFFIAISIFFYLPLYKTEILYYIMRYGNNAVVGAGRDPPLRPHLN
ncbi:MAG: hypothetical protein KAQ87_00440 [Candidatus Pacebacteria bacterium]|nr:hypothetical protein [Candidatus Paceibacterota bacterium]